MLDKTKTDVDTAVGALTANKSAKDQIVEEALGLTAKAVALATSAAKDNERLLMAAIDVSNDDEAKVKSWRTRLDGYAAEFAKISTIFVVAVLGAFWLLSVHGPHMVGFPLGLVVLT